jgi:osomolarity two-component system response regulator SSK1
VKEWGCMQALIDFDGWRKWKDFANDSDTTAGTSKLSTSYSSIAPRRGKSSHSPTTGVNPATGQAGPSSSNGMPVRSKDEDRKGKRRSMGVVPPPMLPEEDSQASTPEVDSQ